MHVEIGAVTNMISAVTNVLSSILMDYDQLSTCENIVAINKEQIYHSNQSI